MAKTKAPLFGFDGSGQIGQALVFGSWRGVGYARRYTVPANPRSAEQTKTRNTFRWLEQAWKQAPLSLRRVWNAYAKGRPFVGRNAWVGQNVRALRDKADLADIVISPGANGGVRPTSISLTAGTGSATVDVVLPPLPTAWTFTKAYAIAIPDLDSFDLFSGDLYAGEDTAEPPSITISGLTAGQAYRVGVWLEYTKEDGKTAFGASLTDVVTPT